MAARLAVCMAWRVAALLGCNSAALIPRVLAAYKRELVSLVTLKVALRPLPSVVYILAALAAWRAG